jgi:hypothetical protein
MSTDFEMTLIDGKKFVRVPPNASRMTRGMARLGYEFQSAIADLIDNSIAAEASVVDVKIEQRIGGKIYVHVLDNGIGIKEEALPSAIQYGANDRNDDHSLGVYGFGLKTACQSFTNKFFVVSKTKSEDQINMIAFDESVIDDFNDFLYLIDEAPRKFKSTLEEIMEDGSGTLIVVEDADRFFTSEDWKANEQKAQRALAKKVELTKDHLRKVFQRFVDFEDSRASNVRILVNGDAITPWDPFCLKEEGMAPESEIFFKSLRTKSGKEGDVILRGYILPAKDDFKNREIWQDAQIGPNTHGIYVYRENRCIVLAEYFTLAKRETHLSNLRIEFSYDGTLDELFHTGLQKGAMTLGDLEDAVRDFLIPLKRETDLRSRGQNRKKDTKDIHAVSQRLIGGAEGRVAHAPIVPIDGKTASVTSKYGEVVLPINSIEDDLEALPINPVQSIDDGLLWQLRLHNNKQVVELNKGHDFYNKIYLPVRSNSIAIRGLDSVFWALAITEANCAIPEYQKQFREFRYEVSKILRELVESMPEPKFDEDDD